MNKHVKNINQRTFSISIICQPDDKGFDNRYYGLNYRW